MKLPEDLSRWPDDPYTLLGVERSIGARDLRRAYTRLIKVYKPEHAPEEFRKLREAYETISQHLKWRERYGIHIGSDDDELAEVADISPHENGEAQNAPFDSESHTNESDSGTSTTQETTAPERRPVRTIITDPLQDAWQLALDGAQEQAFVDLKKFAVHHGMTPAVTVRLYWLLITFPELEPKIQPAGILARGLLNDGWESPLAELYRRELENQPLESTSQRCEQLLAVAPAFLLSEWLPIRWRMAMKKNRYDLLQHDLARFRAAILRSSEEQWASLLFEALDQLAWSQDPQAVELFEKCRAELESLTHLQLPLSNAYDRADLLYELKLHYQSLHGEQNIPTALKELLAECWGAPYLQIRSKLVQFSQWLALQPQTGLQCLDRVHSVSKDLLCHLNDSLRRFAYSEGVDFESDPEPEQLCELLAIFLGRNKVWYYHELRHPLLEFCHRHGFLCEDIAAYGNLLVKNFRLGNGEMLLSKLTEDLPLRCACYAQRVYYG